MPRVQGPRHLDMRAPWMADVKKSQHQEVSYVTHPNVTIKKKVLKIFKLTLTTEVSLVW